MRVHLLCDHKWRDMPNLTAIKLFLEDCGHRVLLSTTKDAEAMIAAFRPDCVVFNHLFAPANQTLARKLKDEGIAVVILPTEGTVRPEIRGIADGEFAQDWAMDLYLAWSEPAAEGVRRRWGLDDRTVLNLGCTRFDFYTEAFRAAVKPRQQFCQEYGLDEDRPIATWATTYAFADAVRDDAVFAKFVDEARKNGISECYRRIGVDERGIAQAHLDGRTAAANAVMALARARPNIQVIVKPHPAESRSFYEGLIADSSLPNVTFCPTEFIWNVLNATSLHLHRQCTTAVEAWMFGKPTVELGMDRAERFPWADREKGSDMVTDEEGLIALTDRRLSGEVVEPGLAEYRNRYIHRWFGRADGKACYEAARAIDQLLTKRRPRSYWAGIKGLDGSLRRNWSAGLRYALSKRPNESLLRGASGKTIDPFDKLITRADVERYAQLLRPIVTSFRQRVAA